MPGPRRTLVAPPLLRRAPRQAPDVCPLPRPASVAPPEVTALRRCAASMLPASLVCLTVPWCTSPSLSVPPPDLVRLPEINVSFSLGQPFLPYEQLLAVQPSSRWVG